MPSSKSSARQMQIVLFFTVQISGKKLNLKKEILCYD